MRLDEAQRAKDALRGNSAFPWDDFDSLRYAQDNYSKLRDDDLRILQLVRDFFAQFADTDKKPKKGIDVGAGANLYPALAMLPLCESVRLLEFGAANIAWLNEETQQYSTMWDQYWHVLEERRIYRDIEDPRTLLRQRTEVVKGDLFKLGSKPQWDIGTMFFVAESISQQDREFIRAVKAFMTCLKPGSPFAAAFMEDSTGYYVGPHFFPAVAVNIHDIRHELQRYSDDLDVEPIQSVVKLRDGYHRMILALGTVRKKQR